MTELSRGLAAVHFLVGPSHHRRGRVVGLDQPDSDRDAERQLIAVVQEFAAGDHVDQAPGGLVGGRLVRIFQKDSELVAPDSRTDVALADAARKQVRHLDQSLVAGAMAKRIVDRLEAVDVDEQHCGRVAVAAHAGDQPLQLAQEPPAVGKIDQAVLVRQMVELLDALLQLRDQTAQRAISSTSWPTSASSLIWSDIAPEPAP